MKEKPKGALHIPPLWIRLEHNIQRRLLSGLLVLVPLGITVFIFQFIFQITAGLLSPLIGRFLGQLPDYVIAMISISILLIFLYLVGVIATHVLGKRLISLGEALLIRIPFVKTIYSASKQVVDVLSLPNRNSFKGVVLIEFPRPGYQSVGFVTGKIINDKGEECYKIFVPTTPNPTSGFLQIVPCWDAVETQMTVEEAVKMIMSGGILAPVRLERDENPSALNQLEAQGSDSSEAPRI